MATITGTAAQSTSPPREGLGVVSIVKQVSLTSVTANDVVQVCKVPSGAKMLDVKLSGANDGGAIVGTVTVGDGGDPDRYITSISLSAASTVKQMTSAAGGMGYEYSADDTLDITFAAVSVGSGTATLMRVAATYSTDT
jgi:hypothetical protein